MKLSVVMSVVDGASSLAATLDSIVAQTEPDFELIVVDDGSADATPSILAAYAERDRRIRVITQRNSGLTRALIRGCSEADSEVIARHDAGDRSHPDRFRVQLALLDRGHVLTGCSTRVTDADGDTLYVARGDGDELRHGLLHAPATAIRSLPHHGSAMFRRDAYVSAGGYREEFRLAQDLDLWIRLALLGTVAITDAVLYEAAFLPRSISGSSRAAQVELTEIAVALRDGGDEGALLQRASGVRGKAPSRRGEAAAMYFAGRCLLQQGNPKWRRTMFRALRLDPLHWHAWASLILRR